MQAQKMESIGRLAAGIAHEINTPIQYVGDNIHFLADALVDLFGLINEQKAFVDRARGCPELSDNAEKIRQHAERIDIDYYCSELPNAVSQAFEGVDRITGIVRAMKEFSHPGGDQKQPTDLNKAIESTVTVCRNEWKYVAELELNLDPNLHEVSCYISEINQVVLNMIVNAAHAIEPKHLVTGTKGVISIFTRSVDKAVEIRISDTGTGISEEIREKIFDPFFTTKEVGKGTGQGLAIAYSTVTDNHGGTIEVESAVGQGTMFILRLPLTESV
jgi:signal transduction histidine kinase